jgi:hypothetical protein
MFGSLLGILLFKVRAITSWFYFQHFSPRCSNIKIHNGTLAINTLFVIVIMCICNSICYHEEKTIFILEISKILETNKHYTISFIMGIKYEIFLDLTEFKITLNFAL